MIMKHVNWWKVAYEVFKALMLALAGGSSAAALM